MSAVAIDPAGNPLPWPPNPNESKPDYWRYSQTPAQIISLAKNHAAYLWARSGGGNGYWNAEQRKLYDDTYNEAYPKELALWRSKQ